MQKIQRGTMPTSPRYDSRMSWWSNTQMDTGMGTPWNNSGTTPCSSEKKDGPILWQNSLSHSYLEPQISTNHCGGPPRILHWGGGCKVHDEALRRGCSRVRLASETERGAVGITVISLCHRKQSQPFSLSELPAGS